MEENNNKAKHDGRSSNHRRKRNKIIPTPNGTLAPYTNRAKKRKSERLSKKAINEIFGSEMEMWKHIAEAAKDGSFKHLEMLQKAAYKSEDEAGVSTATKAPVINFTKNITITEGQNETIDIHHTEE